MEELKETQHEQSENILTEKVPEILGSSFAQEGTEQRTHTDGKGCSCTGVGWTAWCLLTRVFIYNLLLGINFNSFGLLYVEYTHYFQASKASVGWIIAIQFSVNGIAGKIAFSFTCTCTHMQSLDPTL